MNMNCINANEVMNENLIKKQNKVLSQIDNKLKELFSARMNFNFLSVALDTDEQVSTRINELIGLRKQCVNLETFGQVESAILDNYRIDYNAD